MNILVILNNGFEELEATATIDILQRAGYNVTLAGDTITIISKHNITYSNLKLITEINFLDYDLLFLPGGGYIPTQKTNGAIKFFYENNKYLAAICSGPTYFGKLGYLKNKNYVCFPALNTDFGGNFIDDYVIYDKPFFTARSVAASFALPFKIVLELSGKTALNNLLKQMEYLDSDILN